MNEFKKPHNPLIDIGGLMSCSMVHVSAGIDHADVISSAVMQPAEKNSDRYQHVQSMVRRMVGGLPVQFNNTMYAFKRENVYRSEVGLHCCNDVKMSVAAVCRMLPERARPHIQRGGNTEPVLPGQRCQAALLYSYVMVICTGVLAGHDAADAERVCGHDCQLWGVSDDG